MNRGRLLLLLFSFVPGALASSEWIRPQSGEGGFPLVAGGRAATFVVSPADHTVVSIAASDLAADIEQVTGLRPPTTATPFRGGGPLVLIGTLGRHPIIDRLVAEKRLDVGDLFTSWESFIIATVTDPLPGVPQALVIAGSDRRGTAFGVYELSQAIGVSPWHWWADVVPAKKAELYVAAGMRRFGPPSVKYRGIFINDEDWGLQPWAAQTFEPENGGIGPKTYQKVFELLLRLKANTLWPAMHKCTKPFNADPRNARLADQYAIVMGSSHAEPMLRNNVGEWTAPPGEYNYVTNRDGVLKYWEERIAASGQFENIYTVGMRGIHDSNMLGPKSDAERIKTLERIFVDQRALLAKYVHPEAGRVTASAEASREGRLPNAPSPVPSGDEARRIKPPSPERHGEPRDDPPYPSNPESIPQMFCAYKEVLDLYRQGLKVPDDVTIVWPDDNFGYVRNFASAEERRRAGGFGVYYHISYLGRPLSYLWLCTTPPALIWEEMTKAYEHGADRIWIVNVGDLKPAEIGTEFFLQLAWDIHRWRRDNLPDFFVAWATREFGAESSKDIAGILAEYYQLNYQRKPEHLQWWLPNETPRPGPLTRNEINVRLEAFSKIHDQVIEINRGLGAEKLDAFTELVGYPVLGATAANRRYFFGEEGTAPFAQSADFALESMTRRFNEAIAGGKWRGFMRLEPADDQWRSMRIAPWKMPGFTEKPASAGDGGVVIALEAEHFTAKADRGGAAWGVVPGLGRTGDSVAVFPTTMAGIEPSKLASDAPRLDYEITFATTGEFTVNVDLVPTHPIAGTALRFGLALDDAPPEVVALEVKDGGPEWAQGVLNAARVATRRIKVTVPGTHTLRLYGVDAGVLLDKIVIDTPSTGSGPGGGGLKPSYLGPPDTRVFP